MQSLHRLFTSTATSHELAQDELDSFSEQTAHQNDMGGDLKSFPQIATLKTASAKIGQLNKQLSIADGHEGGASWVNPIPKPTR